MLDRVDPPPLSLSLSLAFSSLRCFEEADDPREFPRLPGDEIPDATIAANNRSARARPPTISFLP